MCVCTKMVQECVYVCAHIGTSVCVCVCMYDDHIAESVKHWLLWKVCVYVCAYANCVCAHMSVRSVFVLKSDSAYKSLALDVGKYPAAPPAAGCIDKNNSKCRHSSNRSVSIISDK